VLSTKTTTIVSNRLRRPHSVDDIVIIIHHHQRFVSAPTVKNIGAWQCTCGKKGYETTWKQDCFKFSLENRERRQFSGVLWKLIPCRWIEMWKRPFSEFRPKSRLGVTRRVGGAQTKWTWWSICRLQHVGEVRRAATVVYTVHRQAQLVGLFNSWANRKPVQLA